jgi:excisionase family DNA binding protein
MTDRLIGIRDAAHRLGISPRTLYRMEDRGEIERVVVTGRRFGYRESDVDDIVAGRVSKGKRTPGHKGWIKQATVL